MSVSKVFFTDFRAHNFENMLDKLRRLCKSAGMETMDFQDKFTAIKMHFGELGNISYLRPNYARAVVDMVKELGGKPFLTELDGDVEVLLESLPEALAFLQNNPQGWVCAEVLDDLLLAARAGQGVPAAKPARGRMGGDPSKQRAHKADGHRAKPAHKVAEGTGGHGTEGKGIDPVRAARARARRPRRTSTAA